MVSTEDIKVATKVFKTHVTNIKTQCDIVKHGICTAVKIDNIDNVTPDIIKGKLTKVILSDYLLSLLNLSYTLCNCDYFCKYIDQLSSNNTDTITKLISDTMVKELAEFDRALKFERDCLLSSVKSEVKSVSNIEQQVQSLQLSIERFKTESLTETNTATDLHTPGHDLLGGVSNPTKHIDDYITNFIPNDAEKNICDILSEQKFERVRGRSVISFGEPYRYTGSPRSQNTAVPIPDPIKCVMDEIRSKYPDCDINQCTVNKYIGSSSDLPVHSDDEITIKPGSQIFTVSLGVQRDIKFCDVTTGDERVVTPDSCSLYVMSQASQFLWSHRIDPAHPEVANKNDVRYSLTFRCVGQNFTNSCIILGDSNTQHLSFGSGEGTFGPSLPGKRVETFHIRDIDATQCIGYKNIILHVGVNDLRDKSPGRRKDDPDSRNVRAHFDNFVDKIREIRTLCRGSCLIISPIIPTKLVALNNRACHFNRLLWDYVARFATNVMILDFHCFLNNQGFLDDTLGVYNKPWDKVHLGRLGIRLLAKVIKDCVKYKYVGPPGARPFSSVLSGKGVHDEPLQTSS